MTADMINHPPHYTRHPSGVECIQITRHMGFNLGNAVKYIWRADLKGAAVEDLEKAVWYIRDEIAKRKAASTLPNEGLPFAAHMARRDAERAEVDWGEPVGVEFDTDPQPLEWPDEPPAAPSEWGKPVGSELKIYPLRAEIGPGGATLTKRQCDCGETAGECFCPSEWPAAPIGSPPDGLGDASATHAAKSAEGPSAARVCGGCKWWKMCANDADLGRCELPTFGRWAFRVNACGQWQPRLTGLAGIAASDATAWHGQDGGVA